MTQANKVSELHILDADGRNTVFSSDKYCIPLYQRDYAWEEKQIVQLLEDIDDVKPDENYYIGSLIVAHHEDMYEVIDGQQRLTTLFLLLSYLGLNEGHEEALFFSCRDKSNYTLRNIKAVLDDKRDKFDEARLQQALISGLKIIKENLERYTCQQKTDFVEKLKNIVIYRIEVPEHTDLNHYFEIMNTRGEQLEQSDVLKARMMGSLNNTEQPIFAAIWDACRDMTGYVQMHFSPGQRGYLFGNDWSQIPPCDFKDYKGFPVSFESKDARTILDIIQPDFNVEQYDEDFDDGTRVRFESIVDFPYFLLHVLKVYLALHQRIKHEKGEELIYDLLDDKKLTASFERVMDHGVVNGCPLNKSEFSRKFMVCLLRSRYLFDRYIIKREYANDSSDGEWSLKSLFSSGGGSSKRAYYKDTTFSAYKQWGSTSQRYHPDNLMLQSALRVSYTSPKVMHWITELLVWLSSQNLDSEIRNYFDKINEIALRPVKEFINGDNFSLGVNTPHVVLNYLDFLLWRDDSRDNKTLDFNFEFRNSVEHWYPRNPSEGTFERWDDDVDRFGNLCLIQRNVNSRFSNMSPEAKKSTFQNMIAKGSLKLRLMSELTSGGNASLKWRNEECARHEKEMIERLRNALL